MFCQIKGKLFFHVCVGKREREREWESERKRERGREKSTGRPNFLYNVKITLCSTLNPKKGEHQTSSDFHYWFLKKQTKGGRGGGEGSENESLMMIVCTKEIIDNNRVHQRNLKTHFLM